MFVSRALSGGAEACVEDWGLMKSSTTAACCVCLPFRPAARTTGMKGGQAPQLKGVCSDSFRFDITENM